jgi:hypothetical protein
MPLEMPSDKAILGAEAIKPFLAPTKCSTSITVLLVAIAPRVAKVTERMVAAIIRIKMPTPAAIAVPAIVRI